MADLTWFYSPINGLFKAMCYAVYLSTDSQSDLAEHNSNLVRFERLPHPLDGTLDGAPDAPVMCLLAFTNRWYVGSKAGCGIAARPTGSAKMPSNYTIAKQLKRLGDYLAISGCGEGHFADAVFVIQGLRGERIEDIYKENRLLEVSGVDEEVASVIGEIINKGTPQRLQTPINDVPLTVLELVDVPGLGTKTARRLWLELGIGSLNALDEALVAGRLDELKGIGPKMRAAMENHIAEKSRKPK